ncbi:sucrose-phosphate phosphatase [Chloroflexota bacterium]
MTILHSNHRKIIFTDLDGTFIGDDDSMYELLRLIKDKDISLVFSTGRHLPSVSAFINEKGIRKPDACILQVGTEVYLLSNGEFVLDSNWSRIISQDWERKKIVRLLADIKELVRQDEEWQTEFKASYFLKENQTEVLQGINHRLQQAQLKAHTIYSAGQFLDFLPPLSGKAEAAKYITGNFGLQAENVIVCGDTGNDLDMFKAGFKGIIVGNAHTELKSFNGDNAYHAAAHYAAGIIEGLKHFNFIP